MDRQNATAKRGQGDHSTRILGGGEPDTLAYIREYATQVVRGSEWLLREVDLSAISFEIRHRARRRHGVAVYDGADDGDRDGDDGESGNTESDAASVTVGISPHTIENAPPLRR